DTVRMRKLGIDFLLEYEDSPGSLGHGETVFIYERNARGVVSTILESPKTFE
ncbi:MAG: hypothetical protein IH897_16500, partial [Planctomycetes bacterium]|nr:hypothetical protein [Planctomycetota bacterium]